MRIGDAAAAAGTTPRALRFYEANGLLPPPRRTRAGQRAYGPGDVARLTALRDQLATRIGADQAGQHAGSSPAWTASVRP
jgi:DNA-binding transcriptional MerR regulator